VDAEAIETVYTYFERPTSTGSHVRDSFEVTEDIWFIDVTVSMNPDTSFHIDIWQPGETIVIEYQRHRESFIQERIYGSGAGIYNFEMFANIGVYMIDIEVRQICMVSEKID